MHTLYKCMLALFLAAVGFSSTEAQILNRQVNSSAGDVGKINDMNFSFTIGDLATTTLSKGALMITQGFQQPEELPPVDPGTKPVLNMIVYPNPASVVAKLEFDMLFGGLVYVFLINSSGQVVYKETRTYGAGRIVLSMPIDHLAAGIYTVRLQAGGYAFQDKLIVQ